MVEGPGCKVKGEIMKKKIKGEIVRDVSFTSTNHKVSIGTGLCKPHELTGLKVAEVRTLGKELFVFFEKSPVCIRIHFLMDGFVRYGEGSSKMLKDSTASLTISFTNEKLSVFNSGIDLWPSEESASHCDLLADLDICSPLFNFKKAQQKIEEKPTELICDVIMDQTILPGVGNIIKNEGLFKSGIKPTSEVRDLSSSLVTCLLHRLRDFSTIFYNCRKNQKPLKHHMSIYEKSKCSQCKNQVIVCKPGRLKRLTFYCNLCQVNSNLSTIMSLPKKNSLLSFLKFSDSPTPNDNWECSSCTFINILPCLSCRMCSSTFSGGRKRSLDDDSDSPALVKRSRNQMTLNECNVYTTSTSSYTREPANASDLNDGASSKRAQVLPECHRHLKPCSMKTVNRQGENKGRLFYSCSVGGNKQCNFFQWADLHHPVCKHNKRTILRRVLKQTDNNGKEFYCCPLPKNSQCNFFQWAQ